MINYKIRDSDWLTFPLIIVNFNHFFMQPAPSYLSSYRFSIYSRRVNCVYACSDADISITAFNVFYIMHLYIIFNYMRLILIFLFSDAIQIMTAI